MGEGGTHINLPNDAEEGFSVGIVFVVFVRVNRVLIQLCFRCRLKLRRDRNMKPHQCVAPNTTSGPRDRGTAEKGNTVTSFEGCRACVAAGKAT